MEHLPAGLTWVPSAHHPDAPGLSQEGEGALQLPKVCSQGSGERPRVGGEQALRETGRAGRAFRRALGAGSSGTAAGLGWGRCSL